MKYKEFREYLTLNKIPLKENEERLIVDNLFKISKTEECLIWFSLGFVEYPHEYDLLKKVIELAETPLSEREDEKKYYLKYRIVDNWEADKYVNCVGENYITLSGRREGRNYKTEFTRKEIEKIKKRFNTDLSDFELIEVED